MVEFIIAVGIITISFLTSKFPSDRLIGWTIVGVIGLLVLVGSCAAA